MNESIGRLGFLWSRASAWQWRIAASLLGLLVASAAALIAPWLLKLMADRLTGRVSAPDSGLVAALFVLVMVISSAIGYAEQVEFQMLGFRLRNMLRGEFFSILLGKPLRFFEGQRAGELSARATEDFSRMQPLFSQVLAPLAQNAIIIAGCFLFMSRIHPGATAGILALLLLPIPGVVVLSRRLMRQYAESTFHHAEANALLEESIVGVREVKAFLQEEHLLRRYILRHERALASERTAARIQVGVHQAVSLLLSILLIGIFYAGTSAALLTSLTIGETLALYFYAYMVINAAIAIGRVFLAYQGMSGSFERTYSLMRDHTPILRTARHRSRVDVAGGIQFRDVHFSYDSAVPVLRGASMTVPTGTQLLLTGASGSGKSTLVNLLVGLLVPDSGQITIDGRPPDGMEKAERAATFGYVGQDPVLFRGTVRENILWCVDDGQKPDLDRVVHLACLDEVVATLPNGLDTTVGERGHTLSGGEKARIAIARALVLQPAILILDEANAVLGETVERRLWQRLLPERKGLTTIVVSHHHESLPPRFRQVTLNNGRVAYAGKRRPALVRMK
jgi:ABC-type multidrug transport system fused ATPase/permease subunit